jgi:hypothetical protein
MAVYQVRREQVSDRQWSNLCQLFELLRELKPRVDERRAAAGISVEHGRVRR